jgi:hypothetical protein
MSQCGSCLGDKVALADAPCYLCDRPICVECALTRVSCARCFVSNPILKDEAIKLLRWWGFDPTDPKLLAQAMDACDLAIGIYLVCYPAAERAALLRSTVPTVLQSMRDRGRIKRTDRASFLDNPFGLPLISQ